jgi:hypothetical protein
MLPLSSAQYSLPFSFFEADFHTAPTFSFNLSIAAGARHFTRLKASFPHTLVPPALFSSLSFLLASLLFFPPLLLPTPRRRDRLGAVYQLDSCTYNLLYRLP